MKTLFMLMIFFSTIYANSTELLWVDEQIQSIKPNRVGVDDKTIASVKNPFLFLEKNTTLKKKKSKKVYKKTSRKRYLSLSAIMNNSAFINSKWYKKGNYISGYKILDINQNSVTLLKSGKKTTLHMKSNHKKLNFKK